ncbi:MAG: hypothetical protein AAGI01_18070, partial [Myxococcota bacterium]
AFSEESLLMRFEVFDAKDARELLDIIESVLGPYLARLLECEPMRDEVALKAATSRHLEYISGHRANITGQRLLSSAFGEQFARDFLADVFFPMPR